MYIANFEQNEANPWTRGGFLCFIVIKEVPGRKVSDIWEFDPTESQRKEQGRIQVAFKVALL